MANNPYVNKVQLADGTSLIDISDTTATADKILQGYTAYGADGAKLTGTATGGGGSVTQDQDGFIVLPPDGGGSPSVGGLEYEEGTWTPASDVERGEVLFSDTHTEAPWFIQLTDASDATTLADGSNETFTYVDLYKLNGAGVPYGNSGNYFRYSLISYNYMWNNGSTLNSGTSQTGRNSNDPGDTSSNYPRYFAKEDRFYPFSISARYWRAGRIYKWIAVWLPTT